MRIVEVDPSLSIGVFNCGESLYALEDRCSHDDGPLCEGELYALEDRCSHDDGPLCMGNWDAETCVAFCPRHGASFDIKSGRALTLPAYLPVRTFPVRVEDGIVKVDL